MTKSIGEILYSLRKEKGWTQKDVADFLFYSSKTISTWEIGRTIPNLEALEELSLLYGISIDDLIKGTPQIEISKNKQAQALTNINFIFNFLGIFILNYQYSHDYILGAILIFLSLFNVFSLIILLSKTKKLFLEKSSICFSLICIVSYLVVLSNICIDILTYQ